MESMFYAVFLAVPFYFIWNELAPIYFYWLPEVYRGIPFWHCVGLFILLTIFRYLLIPTPSFEIYKTWKTYRK